MISAAKQVGVIAAQDFRYLALDPIVAVTTIVMPLVVSFFVSPLFELALQDRGIDGASGAEGAIPGLAVMFSFVLVSYTGFSVFREHGWNTWNRLRSLQVPKWVLLTGKGLPPLAVLLLQQATLLTIGATAFGLAVVGNVLPLLLLAICFGASLIGLALLLVTLLRSVHQIEAVGNLCTIVLGGLGGAIAPVELLPGGVQALARATPSYWAVEGYRNVLLTGGSYADIAPNCLVLAGAAIVSLSIAGWRFDVSEEKLSWV